MATLKKSFYTTCYIVAIILLLAFAFASYQKMHSWGGCLLALFFVSLAIAFRGSRMFKGYWYSVVILAVATLAMYFPQYFKTVGGKEASFFIPILLQVIMFGMGTELSLKDFARVMRMPKGVIVGIVCHYTIMPLVGFTIAHLFNFPGEIAAGIILIGCCPSGLASNVMCYLAKANLALSVSVTTVSTLLAPFLTPLLMKLLGGSYIKIDLWAMVWDITKIVIIPIAAGLAFHYIVRGKVKWLDKVMPVISMIGIALVLLVITAAGRDNLLKVGGLLIVATFIHNMGGYFLGYWSARLLKFPERDCRTIALEVGMQNAGLASALAKSMGKIATVGLASVIFGTMMNVTGSSLASWWHNRTPGDEPPEKELL
ncbi:MAG: bile acid:sodium symporter family protein [Bacteroidetes bacterium]|nr:MAG: bile acid:sodium symporter family protein [Bacteroidota bacterium]